MDENDHQFPTIWLLCVSATSMQGMSLSSRGSGSSLEPLSGTSSASHSHSFRTPDNMAIGNVTVSSANQPPLAAASNIDANRLMQQLQQQQQQQAAAQQAAAAAAQQAATTPQVVVEGVDDLAGELQVDDWQPDPNEPRYCLCNQVSYREMVGCDNRDVSVMIINQIYTVW